MEQEKRQLRPFRISFEIYASDEKEAEEARMAIVAFIGQHRAAGRAVTAGKVAQAVAGWDKNPFVRNQVVRYFSD